MKMQIMLGRIDERTQRVDEMLDKMDTRLAALENSKCPNHSKMEKDITSLKINQGKIAADSQLNDEKIRGMVKVNSVKVASVTSLLLMAINWIINTLKL